MYNSKYKYFFAVIVPVSISEPDETETSANSCQNPALSVLVPLFFAPKTTNSELEQHNMLINQNVKQLEGWLKNKKIFAAMQKSENKMLSESEKLGLKQAEIDLKRNIKGIITWKDLTD